MNPERLLAHYERIADAADAVARFRRFILDLAVRGKLVPQGPNDEPASELMHRIATRKARSPGAGRLRSRPELPPVAADEALFAIPPAWGWARFTQIADFSAGRTPSRNDTSFWNNGDHAWVSIADMEDGQVLTATKETVSEKAREIVFRSEPEAPGTIIMSFKLTIGKIARLGIPAFHNEAIISIRPHLAELDAYLFLILPQFARQGDTKGAIKGATLNRDSISNILLPLPPLAEQRRIVAKLDELMALCDGLDAARSKRESTRDRLMASSLALLNSPDPATFRDDVRFVLGALSALTARPDQIKQIRQMILNLAVHGKLVPQDPKDEPALELLGQIAKEKALLVKEGKLKRQAPLPAPDLDQAPFELPRGWTWARFPEVGTFGRGKSKHRPRNDPALFDSGEHLMIQTGDVARSRGVIETYTSKYNEFGLAQSFKWPKGTLCITIAANIADSGILAFDACFPDSVVGFIPASMFANARYFEYFVRTAKANLLEFAPATAQKNINLEILMQVLIPLPPLVEQSRIVAKIDELMALCDRLEAALDEGSHIRDRLRDSLLVEALSQESVGADEEYRRARALT